MNHQCLKYAVVQSTQYAQLLHTQPRNTQIPSGESPITKKTVRTQHVICRLSRCQDGDLGLTVTLSRSMSRQAQADFNQQAHL